LINSAYRWLELVPADSQQVEMSTGGYNAEDCDVGWKAVRLVGRMVGKCSYDSVLLSEADCNVPEYNSKYCDADVGQKNTVRIASASIIGVGCGLARDFSRC
jgi:hypothetical protein